MIGGEDRLRIGCCGSTLDEPRRASREGPARGGASPRAAGPDRPAGPRRAEVPRAGRGPSPEWFRSRQDAGPVLTHLLPACILATLCLSTVVRLILPFYKPG